jgi:glucose-6-phosphate isomerase
MSSLQALTRAHAATRIWQRDAAVFSGSSPLAAADRQSIDSRLGWLDAPERMRAEVPALRQFVDGVRREGLTEIYLLGMGGSSLCAEVLRETAAADPRGASLAVLDTTDERAVNRAAEAMTPSKALFLVASKSGGTVEVSALERFFGSLMSRALGDAAGGHFVAITDPGTPLGDLARERGYRHVFVNPADIGGRYSALSLFGLVPGALLGLDVEALLSDGRAMADRCRADAADNPGLTLGAFMAEQEQRGRDKLTVRLPSSLATLGLWIEQLVAESTGKHGRGLLPVVDEPLSPAAEYGEDRAFVIVETDGDPAAADVRRAADALVAAGHPVCRITAEALGAEFFRWEFATAIAGAGLGINPFDEPNVRDAKRRTQALLDAAKTDGTLPVAPPLKPVDGVPGALAREHNASWPAARRYVGLLDYLPVDDARAGTLDAIRARIRRHTGLATTRGLGPRYLHSTGQYHKGGPDTGLFVLLTSADDTATHVPGTDYSFSTLKQAQALGDFGALEAAGRNVIHLHFERASADVAAAVTHVLRQHALVD